MCHSISMRSIFGHLKTEVIVPELSTINLTCKGHSDEATIIKIEVNKLLADTYNVATNTKLTLPVLDDTNAQQSKVMLKSYCEHLRSPIFEVVSRFHASVGEHNRLKLDRMYLSPHSTAIKFLHDVSTNLVIIIDNHDQYYMQGNRYHGLEIVVRRKGNDRMIWFLMDLKVIKDAIDQCLSAFPGKYHN